MKWLEPGTARVEQTKKNKAYGMQDSDEYGKRKFSDMDTTPFKGSGGKYEHLLTDL